MKYASKVVLLLLVFCPILTFGQGTLSSLENMYSTMKGDTWESVAANYGISVSSLRAANPDISGKKLKKNTLLIIPKAAPVPVQSVGTVQTISLSEEKVEAPERTSFRNLKVGVLLPFTDTKMVEFYRGFLMAADSARKSGVNLDIYTWDCGSSVSQMEDLLPKLTELDIIFGPASTYQIPLVAELCRELGIRLVLPFNNGLTLQEYPLVYNASASNAVLYDVATNDLMGNYADKNYVVVRSDTPDNNGKMLCESLTQKLGRQNIPPRILELEGDDFAYETAFNQFRTNVILMDDSSIRSLNILLARLKDFHQKHPNYHLSLVGFPEWQDETGRLLADFFTFDTYLISPYYYNVLDSRTKYFQRSYERNFRAMIAQGNPRYAPYGFDLAFYFLQGLSSMGDTFERMQGNLLQEPYQNRFRFERESSGMSFSNRFVQFIHYTTENKIELIR